MSHGTYEWVMTHINESWHIWMSHGTHQWVMAHMNGSWHILSTRSRWCAPKTHMNESWHTSMSHGICCLLVADGVPRRQFCLQLRCKPLFHESWHIWMSHGTYQWVMAYVIYYGVATISRMLKNIGLFCKRALQKRPVFCKETCIFKHPTHRSHPIATDGMPRRLTCLQLRCNPFSPLVFPLTMTHSYVPWLIHMYHRLVYVYHDSFICTMTHSFAPWLIHLYHDSFMCTTTHSYVTWLIRT